jgi:ATP-dependent Lon protease
MPSGDELHYEPTPLRAATGQSSASRQAVAQICVLVVDDESVVRRVVGAHLAQRGFLVVEVANGNEALAALSVRKFDILVTDLQMPGMNGHELLAAVHDQYPLVRRVVMTGYTTIENALDALKLGAVGFIPKPVDNRTLDTVIDLAVAELRAWLAQLSAMRRMRPGKP